MRIMSWMTWPSEKFHLLRCVCGVCVWRACSMLLGTSSPHGDVFLKRGWVVACLLLPRSRHPFSLVATDPPDLSGYEVCAVVCIDLSSGCAFLRKLPHRLGITEPPFCPEGRRVLWGSAVSVWRIASPPRCFCTWCSLQVQRLGDRKSVV